MVFAPCAARPLPPRGGGLGRGFYQSEQIVLAERTPLGRSALAAIALAFLTTPAFATSPLLDAKSPIPGHALIALAAVVLGLWQVLGAKGTRRHRIVGWLFVGAMTYVAVTALFISDLKTWGYFSPIHLLIPVTLAGLFFGVRDARRGNIRGHAIGMITLFFLAGIVTGAFTLLPGRTMHDTVFGVADNGAMK